MACSAKPLVMITKPSNNTESNTNPCCCDGFVHMSAAPLGAAFPLSAVSPKVQALGGRGLTVLRSNRWRTPSDEGCSVGFGHIPHLGDVNRQQLMDLGHRDMPKVPSMSGACSAAFYCLVDDSPICSR